MSVSEQASNSLESSPDLAPLRAKWGWIVALGAVYLVAGVIALGSVVMATVVNVFLVGAGWVSACGVKAIWRRRTWCPPRRKICA